MKDPPFRPAGVLLDLDGVLVHSHEAHVSAYEEAFAMHGLPLDDEVRRLVVGGISRRDVMAEARVPDRLLEDVSRAKEEAFLRAVRGGRVPPVAGGERFLRTLATADCPAALVSNSVTAAVWVEAYGLAWAFRVVVDATSGVAAKPSPEAFLVAAERLGVSPERCVAFEDSAAGATAARAAGAWVVGVGAAAAEVDDRADALGQVPLERWLALADAAAGP